jgi:hypothetical protein
MVLYTIYSSYTVRIFSTIEKLGVGPRGPEISDFGDLPYCRIEVEPPGIFNTNMFLFLYFYTVAVS